MSMKFLDSRDKQFHTLVRTRVKAYFESGGISPYGNLELLVKAIALVATTLGLYALIISNRLSGVPLLLAALLFGLSSTLTAFNLAHDAAHGALVRGRRLNALIYVLVFNLQGVNASLWKLRHIGSHHVFPNVEGGDADLDDHGFLRLSPGTPWRWYYRYQHLYAPLLYMLFSLHWIFVYDVQFLFKRNLANLRDIRHGFGEVGGLVLAKLIYLTLMLALPIAMLDVAWWQVVLGFVAMHLVISLVFVYSLICTHFAEETAFPATDADGFVAGTWATHQLATSLDYSPTSTLANLLLGGFNAHAAHHLFPDVCHVHYVAISRIIRAAAGELGLRYNALSYPAAIRSHFRFLKRMGQEPAPELARLPEPSSSPIGPFPTAGREGPFDAHRSALAEPAVLLHASSTVTVFPRPAIKDRGAAP
jgi:linoleoyl-CoA desaturase